MQQAQQVKEFVTRIAEIRDETPTVKSFKVERQNGVEFMPGQFFMVSFPNDPEIKTARAYSIASSPAEKKYLEIALNKIAQFTAKLFALREGDLLKFKGPYGKFYFNDEMKKDIILVAGGTGITPLMSMIRYCNDNKSGNMIRFIYSVRASNEIVYKDELEKIKKSNKNFDYCVTVTRPEESHGWKGKTGRINVELLKENIEDAENSLYFLCGPKEFVDNTISMLNGLNVRKEQIKTDVWG